MPDERVSAPDERVWRRRRRAARRLAAGNHLDDQPRRSYH